VWISLKHYGDSLSRKEKSSDERVRFRQDIILHKNFVNQFKGTCDSITIKNILYIIIECGFFLIIYATFLIK